MGTQRKNQKDLTATERQTYLDAIQALVDSGDYGKLVAIHGEMKHKMHSGMGNGMTDPVGEQRFLPWHREFLLELEALLQKQHASLAIPYWDWVTDHAIPSWMKSFKPTVKLPSGTEIHVARYSDKAGARLPSKKAIAAMFKETDYSTFTDELEGHHNAVHSWTGGVRRDSSGRIERLGTMSDIMVSPADPIFWLHHAQIDRLWDKWMSDGNKGKPTLPTASDNKLDPWTTHGTDLAVIASTLPTRAYSYV